MRTRDPTSLRVSALNQPMPKQKNQCTKYAATFLFNKFYNDTRTQKTIKRRKHSARR